MKNETKQALTKLIHDSVMVQVFKDWLFEESKKADSKAFHFGGQFDLGYAAGLGICRTKFIEYIGKINELVKVMN